MADPRPQNHEAVQYAITDRQYVVPKFSDTNYYFGDPFGKGSKLTEMGFKREYKSTFSERWDKVGEDGIKISIGYSAQNQTNVVSAEMDNMPTRTHYNIEVSVPTAVVDSFEGKKPAEISRSVFDSMGLGDEFYFAQKVGQETQ